MKKISLICLLPKIVLGGQLNLADSPLFLGSKVDPNVFFELDDSGSMDWEILTPSHWHFCAYDPNAGGSYSSSVACGYQVTNGLLRSFGNNQYRHFTYIYTIDDNLYDDDCNDPDFNSIEACTQAGTQDWRVYSSDLNFTYYNPSTTYNPWKGPCLINNTTCANANFTAARSNPREGTTGYSLTRSLAGSEYQVWFDDKGYNTASGRPLRAGSLNVTNTPNTQVDLWDSHIKIVINSANVQVYKTTYSPTAAGMGETTTLLGTLSNALACYNALGPKSLVQDIFNGTSAFNATGGSGCRSLASAKLNFANWYQYQRKRSLSAKAAIGSVIAQSPNYRYGLSVINQSNSLFVQVPASNVTNYANHNQDLLSQLFSYSWAALGTPLRTGLEEVGQYYDATLSGKTDPIIEACQQNFAILLTDGYWNGNNPSSVIGDADGDGKFRTLADVARYYYLKDLSPLPNQVNPSPLDPATYQHMVSFMIAFGLTGNLYDTDQDGWPNPAIPINGNWGNPYNSNPEKIDDLWHAAFNSKGTYVSAQTPETIISELSNALSNIGSRVSSATMAAQNSTTLQTNSYVYQARFDSGSWQGELIAYPIDATGNVSNTPTWNANCVLTGGDCVFPLKAATNNPGQLPSQRVILTRDWSHNGTLAIPFRWPTNYTALKVTGALPSRITSLLSNAPFNPNTIVSTEIIANQVYGDNLIAYLRGDRSQESGNNGVFRTRKGLLGDIINSDPLYVGPPDRLYPDSLEIAAYSTFKSANQNRINMIFAGANDGMMHGFNAATGAEIIGYIPGMREIFTKLPNLSKTNYQHTNFVDGTPNEGDVFVNGQWKTALISGLRNGAQGLFALDITNPNSFNENNASQILMWEFSDEQDPDLGFVYGQIPIVKVRSGAGQSTWAAIVGNGYNNSLADGFASTTGQAAIFILFIEKGLDGVWTINNDYIKIPVGPNNPATPNGLGTPYPVDINGDWITDYIYAGDIKGNIWKFDIRGNTPTNWDQNTTLFFSASQSIAGDQPITAPLVVGPHPRGLNQGIMIYFGTGKYLEPSDNTTTGQTTQTFYGLWDKLDGTLPTKAELLKQDILVEKNQSFDTDGDGTLDTSFALRQVSSNAINWTAPINPNDPAQHLGWYLDLIVTGHGNHGERQITKPILRNRNIIFTTLIPSQSTCDFGGTSWLMELSAVNGGQTQFSPFDLNHDGIFDNKDLIDLGDINGDGVNDYAIASGKQSKVGIASTPAVFLSSDKSKEYKVSNGATGLESTTENPSTGPQGRQSWRQLMP
ncbi:MAG: PilC/PilY family type IV pilus protein [Gammaproteobacteria bacterium]